MLTLLVLRHAKASHDQRLLTDHERPLDATGLRDAPRVGRLLADRGLVPDRVLASTAVRAATTARLAAEAGGFADRMELSDRLYEGGAGEYLEAARSHGRGSTLLVVGHNPAVEGVVRLLAGRLEPMPPAGLARIDLDVAEWADVAPETGRLVRVWRPPDLG